MNEQTGNATESHASQSFQGSQSSQGEHGEQAERYDVVVVGGGMAGLSAAVVLGRSLRSVLVVDSGEPRNATAGHVHNFLTRDGAPPAQILAIGRDEVARYGGQIEDGLVTSVVREGELFRVEIADRAVRRTVTARRLLLATGLRDELPAVPGLAERWGIDVLHCPYCHGWEVRDQRIGVLATSAGAIRQVLLFRQLSAQVTLLRHTAPPLTDQEREQLRVLGVKIVEGRVTQVEANENGLSGVRLADGTDVALDALVVAPRFTARGELAESLGLTLTEVQMAGETVGTQIEANPMGATSVPGVWVAGNLAAVQAQVVSSAASGVMAGAAINADLVVQDTERAVEVGREHGEHAWNERYQSHGHKHYWSGEANPVLVAEVTDLTPGTVFDAGAGEGGDALWLAARGWKVTAADISNVALERGRELARQRGLDITWLHADLAVTPIQGMYDLVTSHYMHMPRAAREPVYRNLAAAVAPGGTLLIVGHDPSDLQTTMQRPNLAEFGWTAGDLAASLGEGWMIEIAEARPREALDPEGRKVTIHDAVLRARRDR